MERPHQARLQGRIPETSHRDLAGNGASIERCWHLHYSIFYCNDELFGYYECEKSVAYAEKVQAESPVVDRWNEYMKDILELEMDPVTGAQPKLEQVFRLD